jgi:2-succinyl-5-enolpyruvyl-6-hydroxy-3-cyclohexene-1-carboxylate synthase
VPLLVLTADRPPELRGTGASQAIDQLKLYGSAVRWFAEAGVPEDRPGAAGYWRSLACKAWAMAAGTAGGFPGPVHLNLPLRDPLVPVDGSLGDPAGSAAGPEPGEWPAWLGGRPGGAPWTSFGPHNPAGPAAADGADGAGWADVDWTERGVLICGDGDLTAGPLLRLAEAAG